jgi:hypothetical protein
LEFIPFGCFWDMAMGTKVMNIPVCIDNIKNLYLSPPMCRYRYRYYLGFHRDLAWVLIVYQNCIPYQEFSYDFFWESFISLGVSHEWEADESFK